MLMNYLRYEWSISATSANKIRISVIFTFFVSYSRGDRFISITKRYRKIWQPSYSLSSQRFTGLTVTRVDKLIIPSVSLFHIK